MKVKLVNIITKPNNIGVKFNLKQTRLIEGLLYSFHTRRSNRLGLVRHSVLVDSSGTGFVAGGAFDHSEAAFVSRIL